MFNHIIDGISNNDSTYNNNKCHCHYVSYSCLKVSKTGVLRYLTCHVQPNHHESSTAPTEGINLSPALAAPSVVDCDISSNIIIIVKSNNNSKKMPIAIAHFLKITCVQKRGGTTRSRLRFSPNFPIFQVEPIFNFFSAYCVSNTYYSHVSRPHVDLVWNDRVVPVMAIQNLLTRPCRLFFSVLQWRFKTF
jgi:hypothetical protein